MATLGGHRGNFTWALNRYNSTDDPATQEKFARHMAHYITAGETEGFSRDDITQGQSYPIDEVSKYLSASPSPDIVEMTEEQVHQKFAEKVDTANISRVGSGKEIVYAYGYMCAPNRLKVGMTKVDCLQRIVQQINESTPDRPILHVEIRTDNCESLERAIHGVLRHRGKRVAGGGDEWFKTTATEVVEIYQFITKPDQ